MQMLNPTATAVDEPVAASAEPVAQLDAGTDGAPAAGGPAWASPKVAWFTISMVGIVTMFGQFDRAIFYLMVTPIKHDLHLSDTHISILMGLAYSIAYFGIGLPVARWTDVGRRKLILPGALALWSAGTFACALASSFASFFVARAMVGGGESVKGPTAVSIISDTFPRNKLPRAFVFYNFSIQGGDALGTIIAGLLLGLFATTVVVLPWGGELHAWQLVFMMFGAPGLLFALIFMVTVPEPARHGRTHRKSMPIGESLHFLLKSPARGVILPILLAAAVSNIEVVGIGSWRPAFYERTFGLKPSQFAPILGTANLIVTPIGLAVGAWLSERMARQGMADANMRLVFYARIAALPIMIASPLMPTFPLALGCALFATFFTTVSSPALLSAMQVVTPNELRAQVNALYMFTLSVIGQGLGPFIIAGISDSFFSEADLRYAMFSVAVVAGPLALFLTSLTLKPYAAAYRRASQQ